MRIAALALIVACSGAPAPKPVAPAAPPDAAVIDRSELAIRDMQMYDKTGELGMRLHADGRFEIALTDANGQDHWKDLGVFHPDGTYTSPDGSLTLVFTASGTVTEPGKGTHQVFHFDGDALELPDRKIALDDHGVYLENGQPTKGHVDGATDAKSRRTALILIGFVLALSQK